jgi:hypothetical protein
MAAATTAAAEHETLEQNSLVHYFLEPVHGVVLLGLVAGLWGLLRSKPRRG